MIHKSEDRNCSLIKYKELSEERTLKIGTCILQGLKSLVRMNFVSTFMVFRTTFYQ